IINCGLANQFVASDWLPLYVRRGTELNESLDRALAAANTDGRQAVDGGVVGQVRELYLEHYRPLYLIFDQFEELFILGSSGEQKRFYETLRELLTIGATCKVLIVIREEYIAWLSELEKVVPALFDNRLRVERLNDSHLARIIVGTTRAAGIRLVEPVVTVTRILENIRDRRTGVDLANLQVYLDRLWRADVARQAAEAPAQVTFDPALVDQVGKLANVISAFLDEQVVGIEAALGQRGVVKPQGIPLEVLFALVTEEGTKRNLDIAGLMDAMPGNRNIEEAHLRFCLAEFERLRLVRPLAAG
ncbi:MAG: hypothetical protein H7066_12965, partial [Cytophagaceae bacterium]|nr:hypothetical protein [Gemmatimonadaceae bacterium]